VKARILIYMSGMLSIIAGSASAEPWSIEPRLGASADYNTNPALIALSPGSEEHIAALVGLPLRYDADGFALSLSPSARISNSAGYSSLASSYTHLDGSAQFTNERGSQPFRANWRGTRLSITSADSLTASVYGATLLRRAPTGRGR